MSSAPTPTPTPTPAARARAVRFDRYGGREVLFVRDVPMPTPGKGEVLVEVRAAGINPGEVIIRSGALHERLPATFPSGEGTDLAGIVLQTGPGVEEFGTGDEVLGFSWSRSSHATHTVVPAAQLIHKPGALSWEVAGALDVAGTTAYAVDPHPGDVVAVSAATGGVGTLVVQLLAQRGVTVLGIASRASAGWLTAHGVIPIEYGNGLDERLRAAAPHRMGSTRSSICLGPSMCASPSISACGRTASTPSSSPTPPASSACGWRAPLPFPRPKCEQCYRN